MIRRVFVLSAFFALSSALSGCSAFFIVRPSYDQVKKVAVVQYTLNPHATLGATLVTETNQKVAASNIEAFAKEMGAKGWQVLSIKEVSDNAGYKAGAGEMGRFVTVPSMRFFGDAGSALKAQLDPATATKLCTDLGVDAVVAMYDSWNLAFYALGFKARGVSAVTVNMYDKTGVRIWGDAARGEGEQEMASPAHIIGATAEDVAKSYTQAFAAAFKTMGEHLAAKP